MELISLQTSNFRNLADDTVNIGTGLNLILGGNGEGKTNLLEAMAVLGNLRSFRTLSLRSMARHGASWFRVSGEVRRQTSSTRLEQVVELGPPVRRSLSLDGVSVEVASYLVHFPVFALGNDDGDLVVGAPEGRRAFIDRFAFLMEPAHLNALRRYRRALRQRNAALVAGVADGELEGWERQLAKHAAEVVRRRCTALAGLIPAVASVYARLRAQSFPEIEISYRGEPWFGDQTEKVEETYCQRYNDQRARDRKAGFTLEGPHRHDLALRADGRPVRGVLSSGQTKIVAAALRLATMAQVEEDRGEILPLIVDDVDAELDPETVSRLVDGFTVGRQAFLSSAHEEEMISRVSHGSMLRVKSGRCTTSKASAGER